MVHMGWTNEAEAGLLPEIIRANDPRPAAEQIQTRYQHGGGYRPFGGSSWELRKSPEGDLALLYPGDPPLKEVSRLILRNSQEVCVLFEFGFVAILGRQGTLAVLRMD